MKNVAVARLEEQRRELRERMKAATLKEALLLHDEIDRINNEIDRLNHGDLPGQMKLF